MASPTRRSGPCSTGRATPTTTNSPRRRATSPRRSATMPPPEQRAEAKAQLARLQGAARPGRRDRLLRRQRPRGGRGAALRARGPAAREGGDGAGRAGDDAEPSSASCTGRTWVTRTGVHVDRIASAWLIRRFIDPEARFKFVPAKGYVPGAGRAALRHVRGRVHARGRPLHLRGAAGACRPRRSGAPRDRRDRPRHRPEGRQVRPRGGGGHQDPDRRHRARRPATTSERLARGGAVFEDLYAYFRRRRR